MIIDDREFECHTFKVDKDAESITASGHGYVNNVMMALQLTILPTQLNMVEADKLFKEVGKTIEQFIFRLDNTT